MRFESLPQIEAKFKSDAASQLKPFAVPVPGEDLQLKGLVYNPPRTDYFYPSVYEKKRICLHFTAGNLRSDMLSLTRQSYHVSVPFVIARDGTIYQLHPSKNWSGHIGAGIGNAGTGNAQDKTTIGIEISNYGILNPRGDVLETIYSRLNNGPADPYCTLANKEAYVKLPTPFRNSIYYPSFTQEQVESTVILLRYLTAKYNIPRKFLPPEKRFVATNDVVNFNGIVTHVNYRPSGKWDLGPAFDWDNVIKGVQAATFQPQFGTGIQKGFKKYLSETEVDELFKSKTTNNRGFEQEQEEATDNEGYNPNDYDAVSLKDAEPVDASGKLYGLIVGIDSYTDGNELYGCVGDAKKIREYINSRKDIKAHLKLLLDKEATKKNIVSQFQNHLSGAKANDTIFIYYSGHGTQEDAAAFWDESDQKLECLVCYNGKTKNDSEYLLTDKELRYLINHLYQKTKAHIVVLFDCCHSGDNTRGAMQIAANKGKGIRRRTMFSPKTGAAFGQRDWSEFIFADTIKKPSKGSVDLNKLLPEAPHIQIAAAESNQSAIESNGEGIFTKNLLKVLQASGANISYNNLYSRVRQIMKFTEEQVPKLYAPLAGITALNRGFLNSSPGTGDATGEIQYNKKNGWLLNKGAIHNVSTNSKVELMIGSKKILCKVTDVFIDYSFVKPAQVLEKTTAHPVQIQGLLQRQLLLELDNWHATLNDAKQLTDEIISRAGGYYAFEGNRKNSREADYKLTIRNGDAIITKPGDDFRPLVRPLPLVTKNDIEDVVSTLIHIARWHFIKELSNKSASAFDNEPLSVKVQLKKGKGFSTLQAVNNTITYTPVKEGDNYDATLKIAATNKHSKPIYVAAINLDKNFGAFTGFMKPEVHFLEPGATVELGLGKSNELVVRMSEEEQQYNWPLVSEFLQFIYSEEVFDVQALTLTALPAPYVLSDRGKKPKAVRRGFVQVEEDKKVELPQWQTLLMQFDALNPLYNIQDSKTLKELLEYEETSFFAAGLYYDVTNDKNGQPTQLTLKKGIKTPPGERGFLDDAKLWLANMVETTQRRKLYNRIKDSGRTKIVAEGDSWFQYPILLKDTLDQLYKLYAIRSYAEAGDTLENYMKKREYLAGLKSEKPKFYLVSGGGNDILGAQFKEYLVSAKDNPSGELGKYLNRKFYDKLKMLEQWYVDMFTEVQTKFPGIYMLTHSYDYVIPVNTSQSPKQTSWLGKYMIEKGIEDQAKREQLINYLLDLFNEHLQQACKKFPGKAFYIDVRNLTPRNCWFDEIHPKNEGFSTIADKFVATIEKLKQ